MPQQTVTLQPNQSQMVSFTTIPLVAKVYQVSVNELSSSFTATTAPTTPIYIEIVDLDSNHNDIVDSGDETAFLAAYGSRKGDLNYNRQFDANFDDVIDKLDYNIFYKTLGKQLTRNDIKTGAYEHLIWPNGWDAYICALNKDGVNQFIGVYDKEGWISIRHHAYILGPAPYYCQMFSSDTAVASYKGLGYGCILPALSTSHAYSIFWSGGDWHDLANWWFFEPQYDGEIKNAASPNLPRHYCTIKILLLESYDGQVVHGHRLDADYASGTVDYGDGYGEGLGCLDARNNEEPVPDIFNRSLGVGE